MLLPPSAFMTCICITSEQWAKPLLRITPQQERGGFGSSRRHRGCVQTISNSLTEAPRRINSSRGDAPLFTGTFNAHIVREKHTDKKGLILDNRGDASVQ